MLSIFEFLDKFQNKTLILECISVSFALFQNISKNSVLEVYVNISLYYLRVTSGRSLLKRINMAVYPITILGTCHNHQVLRTKSANYINWPRMLGKRRVELQRYLIAMQCRFAMDKRPSQSTIPLNYYEQVKILIKSHKR